MPQKNHLERVPLRDRHAELRDGLLAVVAGIQITPTAQEQAVQPIE
jgi:hypothetical protein